MTALDILYALRTARRSLKHVESLARLRGLESPALESLTIARIQVEAAEETIEESLCACCDGEGHDEAQCPQLHDDESTEECNADHVSRMYGASR